MRNALGSTTQKVGITHLKEKNRVIMYYLYNKREVRYLTYIMKES